ncbi:MAG: putative metal-binding motif-containing protein [Deltaproteobacteria bacterium]|nr:putative metal-binding motif-containing protein [Deltaproteobacteria bacterium]
MPQVRWIAPAVLAAFSACTSTPTSSIDATPAPDGAPADTSSSRDATAADDAAPRADARGPEDASSTEDATPLDASDPSDASGSDAIVSVDASAPTDAGAAMCVNLSLFVDTDGDGFGASAQSMPACLLPGEMVSGYSREAGDCAPTDPWIHPGAPEICGDFVDDDCTGALTGAACPTTQAAVVAPTWDCRNGAPPNNVYAYALFTDGAGFFRANGCFVFFEGLPDELYVTRVNISPVSTDSSCSTINGCVCPSLGGWPSYDRRMYAFTLAGAPDDCPEIEIYDDGRTNQPVSNACRKYLLQMHFYDLQSAYVAGSVSALESRLTLFPTVEIACAHDQPHANLPYRTLVTAPVTRNPGFVKQ